MPTILNCNLIQIVTINGHLLYHTPLLSVKSQNNVRIVPLYCLFVSQICKASYDYNIKYIFVDGC